MHNIRLPINENEKKSNNGSMDQSPLVPEMPGTPKIRTTRPDPRKDLFPAPVAAVVAVAAALEVVDIVAEAVVDRTATVGAVVESAAVEQTAVVSDS